MANEERAKSLSQMVEQYKKEYYTETNLERERKELADLKKELEAGKKELAAKEKQLRVKRKELLARMTDIERDWETLSAKLKELLYDDTGVVVQLRDGYYGPFDENERIKALCGEASALIRRQGYADISQFNFFVEMIWELSIRLDERTSGWMSDYLDELTDALTVPEA